jgi:hypothetical protein
MTHLLQSNAKPAGAPLISIKRLFSGFLGMAWMGQQLGRASSFNWHYDDCD